MTALKTFDYALPQSEAVDLFRTGAALEAELAELARRMAPLTSGPDTSPAKPRSRRSTWLSRRNGASAGKPQPKRVETAIVHVKIEPQAEKLTDLKAANAKLTDAVDAQAPGQHRGGARYRRADR